MAKAKNNTGASNDGLALIVGGLFVLALVFATYSYFNRSPQIEDELQGQVESTSNERLGDASEDSESLGDRIRELFSGSNNTGDISPEGAATSNLDDDQTTGEEETDVLGANNSTDGPKVLYSVWVANDYSEGDVTTNNYVVQAGDTLWEIAEARYGNGADWTRILEANSGNIGYLASGQQALITVGQTLVLP